MLRKHTEWIPKGKLLRLVNEKTRYTSENAGRRLRELEVSGQLEVKYVKGHAHYRAKPSTEPAHVAETCVACAANKELVANWV